MNKNLISHSNPPNQAQRETEQYSQAIAIEGATLVPDIDKEGWKKPFRFHPLAPPWPRDKDWVLEIGPGNGKFIQWIAAENPQKLFIAVELRNMRYQGVGDKSKRAGLENLISVHGDARYCLPYLFEESSLSEIYILFPDPWFKRRHHKNRLINPERAKLFHQILKTKGKLFFATDNAPYAEWVKKSFPESHWNLEEGKSLYPTYFETKWKKLGREIQYFVFQKINASQSKDNEFDIPQV